MMHCTLFGEIISYFVGRFEQKKEQGMATYETFAHKLLVDLVFMTFNCSVCYAMAMYLKSNDFKPESLLPF